MTRATIIYQKIEQGNGLFHGNLYIVKQLDSTNTSMLAFPSAYHHGDTLVALKQLRGKGRHGKRWISAPHESLTFSIRLDLDAAQQSCLGQAAALGIIKWLEKMGVLAQIKWPNDVLVQNKKISGILVETRGRITALGIGINLNLNKAALGKIDQPATSLLMIRGVRCPIESALPSLLGEIQTVLELYLEEGFKTIAREWKKYIAFSQRRLTWTSGNIAKEVIIRDIQDNGELLVSDGTRNFALSVGEITI